MNTRRFVKLTVDATMFVLMFTLMGYPMTRGLLRHGVCGMLLLVLFVCHNLLNVGWYGAICGGRWTALRCLRMAANTLLLLDAVALAASALVMAGEVFSFAPFPMPAWGREVHMAATAWFFALASFHLGLHGQRFWNWTHRLLGRAWPVAALAVMLVGGILFVESDLWSDMLPRGEPRAHPAHLGLFVAQYTGILCALCLTACILRECCTRRYK